MEVKGYDDYVSNMDNDLIGTFGKEHYRLLAYVSTLFNNKNLIDIGTHLGHSAYALSYNVNNHVDSFDIRSESMNSKISNRTNISFNICDLWQPIIREKWFDTIMSSPIIFLDIDPHEGTRELEFVNYLINHNYQGCIICDDIHYFENMRTSFWSKIDEQYKHDITKYGHWSGTGLIYSNKVFDKLFNIMLKS